MRHLRLSGLSLGRLAGSRRRACQGPGAEHRGPLETTRRTRIRAHPDTCALDEKNRHPGREAGYFDFRDSWPFFSSWLRTEAARDLLSFSVGFFSPDTLPANVGAFEVDRLLAIRRYSTVGSAILWSKFHTMSARAGAYLSRRPKRGGTRMAQCGCETKRTRGRKLHQARRVGGNGDHRLHAGAWAAKPAIVSRRSARGGAAGECPAGPKVVIAGTGV
jgi:hypothetical protein